MRRRSVRWASPCRSVSERIIKLICPFYELQSLFDAPVPSYLADEGKERQGHDAQLFLQVLLFTLKQAKYVN